MKKQERRSNQRPVSNSRSQLLETGLQELKSTKAFTLVELIVVITILAILGTIAFISLQGYSKNARDSVRISDISKIKTSLELFQLDAGKYPETTDATNITYSGAIAWTQGTFGTATFNNVTKLDKIPTDPVSDRKYVYSVTNTKQEYQIAGVMEGDEVTGLLNKTNAALKTAMLKISGNYNGKVLKVSTGGTDYVLAVPSIITSSGFTLDQIVANKLLAYNGYRNLPAQYAGSSYELLGDTGINIVNSTDLVVFSGSLITLSSTEPVGITARKNLITNLQKAYSGTLITNIGEIAQIINTQITNTGAVEALSITIVSNNLGGSISASTGLTGGNQTPSEPTLLINETTCSEANWIWVGNDVYIGTTQGNGFCISPRIGDFGDSTGNGISWNGWGNQADGNYNGWDSSPIDDGTYSVNSTGNPYPILGQTRKLDSQVSYNCKLLGTSSTDFDTTDNIVGRMKWLSTNKANLTQLQNIEWITGINLLNGHPVPALFLSDCIDGVKDLGTDMVYKHYPNETLNETITYSQYNADVTLNTDNASLSNITYQNRQKYLTAWTQKSGSHLPSAMSYITNTFASASDSDGDNLTTTSRGEYQVACESSLLTDSDQVAGERVWLSAIGNTTGTSWGSNARFLGYNGCGDQSTTNTGFRIGTLSARFVVRP